MTPSSYAWPGTRSEHRHRHRADHRLSGHFQSMYLAVMERTREIGILKALGASKAYIVSAILEETGMLALGGIALGIGVSFAVRAGVTFEIPHDSFSHLRFTGLSGRRFYRSLERYSAPSIRPTRRLAKILSMLWPMNRSWRTEVLNAVDCLRAKFLAGNFWLRCHGIAECVLLPAGDWAFKITPGECGESQRSHQPHRQRNTMRKIVSQRQVDGIVHDVQAITDAAQPAKHRLAQQSRNDPRRTADGQRDQQPERPCQPKHGVIRGIKNALIEHISLGNSGGKIDPDSQRDQRRNASIQPARIALQAGSPARGRSPTKGWPPGIRRPANPSARGTIPGPLSGPG